MLLGCLTNCLPALLPFALALLVAAFSDADKAFHAASGRYLLLPFEGLPEEVLHFCLPQSLRDFCYLAIATIHPLHKDY